MLSKNILLGEPARVDSEFWTCCHKLLFHHRNDLVPTIYIIVLGGIYVFSSPAVWTNLSVKMRPLLKEKTLLNVKWSLHSISSYKVTHYLVILRPELLEHLLNNKYMRHEHYSYDVECEITKLQNFVMNEESWSFPTQFWDTFYPTPLTHPYSSMGNDKNDFCVSLVMTPPLKHGLGLTH